MSDKDKKTRFTLNFEGVRLKTYLEDNYDNMLKIIMNEYGFNYLGILPEEISLSYLQKDETKFVDNQNLYSKLAVVVKAGRLKKDVIIKLRENTQSLYSDETYTNKIQNVIKHEIEMAKRRIFEKVSMAFKKKDNNRIKIQALEKTECSECKNAFKCESRYICLICKQNEICFDCAQSHPHPMLKL